jgi:hypothetical protein
VGITSIKHIISPPKKIEDLPNQQPTPWAFDTATFRHCGPRFPYNTHKKRAEKTKEKNVDQDVCTGTHHGENTAW